jgi:hypothetical protein
VNVVEREDVPVFYVSRRDEMPKAARDAFEELERRVGSLRGRKFYGVFAPREGEYRACVAVKEGDAEHLGLAEGVIPGGRYLRETLRGEPEQIYARIPAAFDALTAAATAIDGSRPSIEFYRRHDEVVLLLPVEG